jgi:membrane fusion protein (multidrug efflux system)
VTAKKLLRSSFQRFITSTGVIKIGSKFPVNSLLTGRINYLSVEEGQKVKKDQIICELDQTSILLDLQHQVTIVEYLKERLENFRKRGKLLSPEGRESVLLLQAEEVKQNILENQRENTRIKIPIDGRIYRLFIQPGEVVSEGAPIAEVVDLSQVTVLADVHQEDLPYLKKGMRVEIRLSQDPQQVFLGEVIRVALEADPTTHRFGLEISLVNLQEKFLPGMAVQVKARGPFMKNVFLVPKSAVIEKEGESFVFVSKSSRAESRKVILGPESEGRWIIHSGLTEGELIITSQAAHLNDGDPVEISH